MAIVGAGLTGLWTAHYLAEADPSLRIVVRRGGGGRVRRVRAATAAGARRCSPLRDARWPGCPRPRPRGAVRRDAILGRRGAPLGSPLSSLWHETTPTDWTPRPPLDGDTEADVAIVGAGLTGLWTAHYLAEADPSLRIVVVEAETAGSGASGRTGCWRCSALFPTALGCGAGRGHATFGRRGGGRVTEAAGIDCHFAKGGTIVLARNRGAVGTRAQQQRGPAAVRGRGRRNGCARPGPSARRTRPTARHCIPDAWCAAWPGPSRVAGWQVLEQTPVTAIEPGRARTAHGTVRRRGGACNRGLHARASGVRGETVVPVYSLMIATEPLSPAVWDQIGLAPSRDLQRPPAPGHLRPAQRRRPAGLRRTRSAVPPRLAGHPAFDQEPRVFASLWATLRDLFPVLEGHRVTHAWGGPLGIPRDWCASVGLDQHHRPGVGRGVRRRRRGAPPTWPGGPCATWCWPAVADPRPSSPRCPRVDHRSPTGSPSRGAGSASTPGCARRPGPTARRRLTGRPSLVARATAPLLGGMMAGCRSVRWSGAPAPASTRGC